MAAPDDPDTVSTPFIEKSSPGDGRPPRRLCAAAALLAFSAPFHFGFQLVLTNPAQEGFISFLNDSWRQTHNEILEQHDLEVIWSLIVSGMFAGSLLGAFLIRCLADGVGRRRAVQLAAAAQAAACSLAIASFFLNSYILYAISRFIFGFFMAIGLGCAPMFLSEASPKACRGVISLSTGIVLQGSIIVSSVLAMPQMLGTRSSWWLLYAFSLAIFLVVLVLLPLLPESPTMLASRGRREETARSIAFFHSLRGSQLHEAVNEAFDQAACSQQLLGLLELWRDSAIRGRALAGCVVMFAMISSGIVVINGYVVSILMNVGLTSFQAAMANIAISSLMLTGSLTSAAVVDRFGRRPLLLATLAMVIIANCLIALLMHLFEQTSKLWLGYSLVGVVCVFAFVFAAGPGPLSFFITAELLPSHARAAAMTWANVVMAAVRALLLAMYLPLSSFLGGALCYFLLFVPPIIGAFIFLYKKLPETKNSTASSVEKDTGKR